MLSRTLWLALCLCIWQTAAAQEEKKEEKSAAHIFMLGIGLDQAVLDLSDRFGLSNKISGGYQFLTRSGYVFGADASFFYGDNVDEDVLAPLRNESGQIVNSAQSFSNVFLRERGLYVGATAGKLFEIGKKSYRSGIKVELGAGVLQHKIRIIDNGQNSIRLGGNRKKGYDRLTRGLALRQYVGYHYMSSNRRINFNVGLEFYQGFTSGVRSIDWDTGLPSEQGRTDGLVGLKVQWMLPFWSGKTNEVVYY